MEGIPGPHHAGGLCGDPAVFPGGAGGDRAEDRLPGKVLEDCQQLLSFQQSLDPGEERRKAADRCLADRRKNPVYTEDFCLLPVK